MRYIKRAPTCLAVILPPSIIFQVSFLGRLWAFLYAWIRKLHSLPRVPYILQLLFLNRRMSKTAEVGLVIQDNQWSISFLACKFDLLFAGSQSYRSPYLTWSTQTLAIFSFPCSNDLKQSPCIRCLRLEVHVTIYSRSLTAASVPERNRNARNEDRARHWPQPATTLPLP